MNHDHDEAQSLHRVVRAMHDGECPKCHAIHASDQMRASDPGEWPAGATAGTGRVIKPRWTGWRCPSCRFQISDEEATAALQEFSVFMERNLEVFEAWRQRREDRQRKEDSE